MADYSTPYKAKENTGNLFDNRYKESKTHPDMTGSMVLSKDLLRELVDLAKEGKEPKIALSVWKNMSRSNGKPYFSVSAKLFKEYKKSDDVPF